MTTPDADDLLIRIDGRAGCITLNRPKALNALTYPQVGRIQATLDLWRDDPAVELVILDGAGDRGLCAGGDIRAMYDSAPSGSAFAARFWFDEYRLNATIARYPKPYVALMDGIVMGGGIGLSGHASRRIVTERSQLAMPETGIGLIPDVGGTWLLSRGKGGLGIYLALSGARMAAADAILAGFADSYVPAARLPDLIAKLSARPGDDIDDIIEAHEDPVPEAKLGILQPSLDRWFDHDSVEAILAALHTTTDEVAASARAELLTRSPTSLKLTLKAVRDARRLPSLEDALKVEYRLVCRLFESGEFIEGIRALIVDKDRQPKWRPETVADVTPDIVARYFAPMAPGHELRFG